MCSSPTRCAPKLVRRYGRRDFNQPSRSASTSKSAGSTMTGVGDNSSWRRARQIGGLASVVGRCCGECCRSNQGSNAMSDKSLKDLQEQWHALDGAFSRTADRGREQTITSEMYKIEGAIADTPADTLVGIAVKADILAWQY